MFQFKKIYLLFTVTISMDIRTTAVRPKEEELMRKKGKSMRSG